MTAGFVCFGVAVPAYGVALRESLAGPAWAAATVSGFATLGVGAFPLGKTSVVDRAHYGFAVLGSTSLAFTPILASQSLSARGYGRAAAASRVLGVLSGVCLVAPAMSSAEGLFQRIGLTLAEGWLAASAAAILSGVMEPS
jgi:hypothetical protein